MENRICVWVWMSVLVMTFCFWGPAKAGEIGLHSVVEFQLPKDFQITTFSELNNGRIYTPEVRFEDNNRYILVKWYDLGDKSSGEISIKSETLDFPIIKVKNDTIVHVDYIAHDIKLFDINGTLSHTIAIENDYPENSYPGAITRFDITGDSIVINNVFTREGDNIQIYDFAGQRRGGFATVPRSKPCDNIAWINDIIYYFDYGRVTMFDLSKDLFEIVVLDEDNYTQHSQYAVAENYLVVIGEKHLTIYETDFTSFQRMHLDEVLPSVDVKNLKLIDSNSHIYILNTHDNAVYRIDRED